MVGHMKGRCPLCCTLPFSNCTPSHNLQCAECAVLHILWSWEHRAREEGTEVGNISWTGTVSILVNSEFGLLQNQGESYVLKSLRHFWLLDRLSGCHLSSVCWIPWRQMSCLTAPALLFPAELWVPTCSATVLHWRLNYVEPQTSTWAAKEMWDVPSKKFSCELNNCQWKISIYLLNAHIFFTLLFFIHYRNLGCTT